MEDKILVDEFLNNPETSKFVEDIIKQNEEYESKYDEFIATCYSRPVITKEMVENINSKPVLVYKESLTSKIKSKIKSMRVSIGLKIAGLTHDDLI